MRWILIVGLCAITLTTIANADRVIVEPMVAYDNKTSGTLSLNIANPSTKVQTVTVRFLGGKSNQIGSAVSSFTFKVPSNSGYDCSNSSTPEAPDNDPDDKDGDSNQGEGESLTNEFQSCAVTFTLQPGESARLSGINYKYVEKRAVGISVGGYVEIKTAEKDGFLTGRMIFYNSSTSALRKKSGKVKFTSAAVAAIVVPISNGKPF